METSSALWAAPQFCTTVTMSLQTQHMVSVKVSMPWFYYHWEKTQSKHRQKRKAVDGENILDSCPQSLRWWAAGWTQTSESHLHNETQTMQVFESSLLKDNSRSGSELCRVLQLYGKILVELLLSQLEWMLTLWRHEGGRTLSMSKTTLFWAN